MISKWIFAVGLLCPLTGCLKLPPTTITPMTMALDSINSTDAGKITKALAILEIRMNERAQNQNSLLDKLSSICGDPNRQFYERRWACFQACQLLFKTGDSIAKGLLWLKSSHLEKQVYIERLQGLNGSLPIKFIPGATIIIIRLNLPTEDSSSIIIEVNGVFSSERIRVMLTVPDEPLESATILDAGYISEDEIDQLLNASAVGVSGKLVKRLPSKKP